MLCVTLKKYERPCGAVTGGLSDVALFDPSDLDFTQAPAETGTAQVYSAVAVRTGVTDGVPVVFTVDFQVDEAEWTWTQSVTGCSVKYEHTFSFQLPDNTQQLTNFLEALDSAGCCCGLGLIIRLNSGKVFVAGEKYVNGSAITKFSIKNSGSEGGTGRLMDDFNGGNINLVGSYNRNLYEFTGGWAAIEALAATTGSV